MSTCQRRQLCGCIVNRQWCIQVFNILVTLDLVFVFTSFERSSVTGVPLSGAACSATALVTFSIAPNDTPFEKPVCAENVGNCNHKDTLEASSAVGLECCTTDSNKSRQSVCRAGPPQQLIQWGRPHGSLLHKPKATCSFVGNAECSSRIQIGQRMVDSLPPSDLKSSSCLAPAADSRLAVAISAGLQDSVQVETKCRPLRCWLVAV